MLKVSLEEVERYIKLYIYYLYYSFNYTVVKYLYRFYFLFKIFSSVAALKRLRTAVANQRRSYNRRHVVAAAPFCIYYWNVCHKCLIKLSLGVPARRKHRMSLADATIVCWSYIQTISHNRTPCTYVPLFRFQVELKNYRSWP